MKTLALIILALPLAASAATISVNTTRDYTRAGDGRCTLREAIANVNAAVDTTGGDCVAGSGTGDTITFSLTLPATIRIAVPRHGELAIARDLTIIGPGPGLLAIDGRHKTRVFHVTAGTTSMSDVTIQNGSRASSRGGHGGGILVDSGATLNITNCTLSGNKVVTTYGTGLPASGGGIEIDGIATLTNCTLSGNTAQDGGAGIEITGTATLTNCTVSGNTVRHYSSGGSIENYGTATLTNCTLSGNTSPNEGGGIMNFGTAILMNCTLSGNTATYSGGGIENYGTATLTNCTLSDNTAFGGGGIENGSIHTGAAGLTLTNCTLSRNKATWGTGGGIENFGAATLTNSTLSGNAAFNGGGIFNYASATLTDCTLSGNTAPKGFVDWGGVGGGIENSGTATLTNCTLSGNTADIDGGGIVNVANVGGDTELLNSIVAINEPHDCGGPPTSNGHNLDSDGTCFSSGGTDLINTPPLLAPLGNYGGPTQTLALCTGPGVPAASCTAASPAIDAGDDSVTGPPDNLTTDQRGLPRRAGTHVDIGAYEVQ